MNPAAAARLAFITGASSGIGQALAAQYAATGWRLALVARRKQAMDGWARAQGLGPDWCRTYAADVADCDSIVAAAHDCLQRQGIPDLVIANAGISKGVDTAERGDLDVMARILATNVTGVAATFQSFIGPMRERASGQLVGMASVAAVRGLPGHGAYCASKAALLNYCESLRIELRGSGVGVTTLLPGFVDTPLTRGNPYPMPFMLSPDAFARRAMRAIARGGSRQVIPWQMAIVAKLLRLLPDSVFDPVIAGRARKPRTPSES